MTSSLSRSDKANTTTNNITPTKCSNRKKYEILSNQNQYLGLQLQDKEAELIHQEKSLRKEFEGSLRNLRKEFEERERHLRMEKSPILQDAGDTGSEDYDSCTSTTTMTTNPISTSMSLLSESSADSTTSLSSPQHEEDEIPNVSNINNIDSINENDDIHEQDLYVISFGESEINKESCAPSRIKNHGSPTIPPSPLVQDSENIPYNKFAASSKLVEQYFISTTQEQPKEEECAGTNSNNSSNESEEAHTQNFDLAACRRKPSHELPSISAQDSKLMALKKFRSTIEFDKPSTIESNGDIIGILVGNTPPIQQEKKEQESKKTNSFDRGIITSNSILFSPPQKERREKSKKTNSFDRGIITSNSVLFSARKKQKKEEFKAMNLFDRGIITSNSIIFG